MRTFLYMALSMLLLRGCGQGDTPSEHNGENKLAPPEVVEAKQAMLPNNLFTLPDAEKILGEPAHLKDSGTTAKTDTLEYQCAYAGNAKDKKTGKTGVIYFMYEDYMKVSSAQKVYSFIKTANEANGISVLNGVGDEAYFHTDGQNFYFVLVRKGGKMFRMKVNKITSTTSLDEFNRITKEIAGKL